MRTSNTFITESVIASINVFSQLTILWKAVKVQREDLIQTGPSPKKTRDKFSVHGLAERPAAPVPRLSTVPAASQKIAASPAASDDPNLTTPSTKPTVNTPLCPNCIPRQETLVAAFEKLRAAQRHVNSAIIVGKEAVERSNAKLGAYDSVSRWGLPARGNMRDYPRHTHEDAIREGTRRRKEEEEHRKKAKGKMSTKSDAGEEERARSKRGVDRGRPKHDRGHGSTSRRSSPLDIGEETDETVPDQFDIDRQISDESSSSNVHNNDSEVDANWELDPDAEEE